MRSELLALILKLLQNSTPEQIKADAKALQANKDAAQASIIKAQKERTETTAQLEAKLAAVQKQIEVLSEPYNKRIHAAEKILYDAKQQQEAVERATKFNDFMAALPTIKDEAGFARAWLLYNTNWDGKDAHWLDRRIAELHFRLVENAKDCLVVAWLENDYIKADKFYLAIKKGRVVSALRVTPAQHAGDYQYARSLGVKAQPKKNDWSKEGPQGLKAWLEQEFTRVKETDLIDFLN